jgi:S1-C subfamily serine protease
VGCSLDTEGSTNYNNNDMTMKKNITNRQSKFAVLILTSSFMMLSNSILFNSLHAFGQQILQTDSIQNQTTLQSNNATKSGFLRMESQELNNIFKNAANSVVYIQVDLGHNYFSSGSGFVYDSNNGYIITNNHVVNGSISRKADVTFSDGNTYTAKIIGTDVYDDIAVLQIVDDFSAEHLVPLTLANSSKLQVGQLVIAIGNPGVSGVLTLSDTMTMGIVSQVGRIFLSSIGGFAETDLIQTDTSINRGNSGGPLLDADGHVVGITTLGLKNSTGLNFAIPSNLVLRIAPAIIQIGHYEHPWLGFSGDTLSPLVAEDLLGLPRNTKGVVLFSVDVGGPLDKAGLKRGDIIAATDRMPIRTIGDLLTYLEEHKSVGDSINLTVNREGQLMDFNATVQARPSSS